MRARAGRNHATTRPIANRPQDAILPYILILVGAAVAIDLPVSFVDIGASSGLTVPNTFGGKTHKDYILETTGNGVAIFDYDRDGAEDIFIPNAPTLEPSPALQRLPPLYHHH